MSEDAWRRRRSKNPLIMDDSWFARNDNRGRRFEVDPPRSLTHRDRIRSLGKVLAIGDQVRVGCLAREILAIHGGGACLDILVLDSGCRGRLGKSSNPEFDTMIHYSCDRCKRAIDPSHELRYVVRLEIEAAIEHLTGDIEDDVDRLQELEEILESSDDDGSASLGDELFQRKRFDLCVRCYRHFCKNPLGKEKSTPFGFSQN